MSDETNIEIDHGGHPSVIAYRMGQVEVEVKGLGQKMDAIIAMYPTETRVLQMLKPLEDDIQELKRREETTQQQKIALQGQLKIAVFAAVASPIAAMLVTIFVTNKMPG